MTVTQMTHLLVDSSFLYALYDQSDNNHAAAQRFAATNRDPYIIADVVLTEVTYLLKRSGGSSFVIRFLNTLVNARIAPQPIILADMKRASEIMAAYLDVQIDFVDCCIMALSERLSICRICTFDRRDFSLYKPKHCDYFELLP